MNDKHISCEQAKEWLTDALKGELSSEDQTVLDAHVVQCPECQRELALTRDVRNWLQTDETPEPSSGMESRFYNMLTIAEQENNVQTPNVPPEQVGPFHFTRKPMVWMQVAATILLLGVGVIAGYWLRSRKAGDELAQQKIDIMAVQMQEMRQMMMLSLLDNSSAVERLQAVSLSTELDKADGKVIEALLTTLNYDTNTNVRLATLEALIRYTDEPQVREGLIASLALQDSPMVQMALADLMVKLQEKRSVKALRQLLRQKGIRKTVKTKVEQSIIQLSSV
ncbi:zf-HC2 domain-containing protein [Dyadobacter bucti]|uniref:zf-HC2 domain-containing protein n=1 Tax=Dyadobacter bucti TaxID=2572203 RepID=UPI001E56DA82|nr:zf-HC2 domain-containing protein [Dyadobacter bucti]